MEKRPNIIFMFTDQQSASMMSCAGNNNLKTPAMDYLAKNGVRFSRAHCTNPVCLPSRFSLMTGRMPSYAGIRSNAWKEETTGIPDSIFNNGIGKLFKKAGYDAVYGGKVHLPGFNPGDIGFDLLTADRRGELAETCADYIKNHDQEKPFFMVSSFINPHDICYMAITDYAKKQGNMDKYEHNPDYEVLKNVLEKKNEYDKKKFYNEICPSLSDNLEPQQDEPEAIKRLLDQRPFRRYARENYSDNYWKFHKWTYCRLTEMVDNKIQIILNALQKKGIENETIIIFSSDHGDHDGSHRMEHKSTLYEEVCRIPFIISDNGEKSGVVNDHLISNGLDFIPTIFDYAGIEPPETDPEGRSIKPLMEGKEVEWRDTVKIESEFGRGIVTDRYKYGLYFEGKNREQLYDLEKDPGEMRNALDDKDKKKVVADMKEKFNDLFG